jgi:hypothetical protein
MEKHHRKFLRNHRKTSTSPTGKLLEIFTGNWSPATTHPLNTGASAPRASTASTTGDPRIFGSPATLGFLPQSPVLSLPGLCLSRSVSLFLCFVELTGDGVGSGFRLRWRNRGEVCLSVCLTGPERALFYTLEETRERNKCVEDVPSSKSFSYTLCLTRPVHLHVYTYISLLLHFETTRV